MEKRKITFYSTKGGKTMVETDATTWGEIKKLTSNYNFSKLIATENIGKTTLEHSEAILPEGDFVIFLRPSNVKSGTIDYDNLSFMEIRSLLTSGDKENLYTIHGHNYTLISKASLIDYLSSKKDASYDDDAESIKKHEQDEENEESEENDDAYISVERSKLQALIIYLQDILSDCKKEISPEEREELERLQGEYENLIENL